MWTVHSSKSLADGAGWWSKPPPLVGVAQHRGRDSHLALTWKWSRQTGWRETEEDGWRPYPPYGWTELSGFAPCGPR
ncbi:hypothetical protein MKZ38_010769 [Zalerion maritima]|uniref:Uncharacterized protein n=1 Tax=Zalerion maritima TaxID=339359 RepID=A0AAD5WV73_9PEZI|nr:hypothetical protein MKZ38_010769 [Zalerion maritima]